MGKGQSASGGKRRGSYNTSAAKADTATETLLSTGSRRMSSLANESLGIEADDELLSVDDVK